MAAADRPRIGDLSNLGLPGIDEVLAEQGQDAGELALKPYGVGIDCHSKFIQVCVYVRAGTEYEKWQGRAATDWRALEGMKNAIVARLHEAGLATGAPDEDGVIEHGFDYTLESTGCYHVPVCLAMGGRAHLVNPSLAAPTRRKTDVLDAKLLAYHALTGLWPATYMADTDQQALRVVMMARRAAQTQRRQALSRINNVLLRYGYTLGAVGPLEGKELRPVVEDLIAGRPVDPELRGVAPVPIPPAVCAVLGALYQAYDAHTKECSAAVKAGEALVAHRSYQTEQGDVDGATLYACLRSIPGIGAVAGLTWLAEVGTPWRFPNAKACAAFCGCDPSLKVSADHVTAHVRRRGNERVHHVLVQCAQYVIRSNREQLGGWGRQIWLTGGPGAWQKAVGAVARRLANALYWVHRKAVAFDPSLYGLAPLSYPHVELSAMRLPKRVEAILRGLDLTTSTAVVGAFNTNLRKEQGVGARTLKEVAGWMQRNARRESLTETVLQLVAAATSDEAHCPEEQ
jgi:transposase